MKKLLCMLLVCMFSVMLFCGAALADPELYDIYVLGTQVTSENAVDVLGDGTVSYDPTTNTLTLNNANIKSDSEPFCLGTNSALNIHLKGKNTIVNSAKDRYGIMVARGLTITGEPGASLDVTGDLIGLYVIGDLNMESGTVTSDAKYIGVYVIKDLNMTGGAISAFGTGEPSDEQAGLAVVHNMNIGSGIRMLEAGSPSGAIFTRGATLDESLLAMGNDGVSEDLTPVSSNEESRFFQLENGEIAKYAIIASEIPDTGDASMPALWAGLLMLSAIGLVVIKKRGIA